ncbi:MAG: TIM barrel protein [Clostridiales bacterium]|nr:TIM barrel protein [Clostridiales bacterium]
MIPRKTAVFGPAGNSNSYNAEKHKSNVEAPAWVKEFGLDCYEYQSGNGVRGSDEFFAAVGAAAAEAGILLSLHAPYYISLSGIDPEKRLGSLRYIRESLNAAALLGAEIIVVHTGSAAKISREEAMDLARDTLSRALDEIPDNGVIIGLETMGKQNQLGTLDEVIELCKLSPRLAPVVDFGHINAFNVGNYFNTEDDYLRIFDKISAELGADAAKNLHCHFSKIEYTQKGEKKHLTFADTVYGPPFEPLARVIADERLTPCIICESDGTQAEDALTFKNVYKEYIKGD